MNMLIGQTTKDPNILRKLEGVAKLITDLHHVSFSSLQNPHPFPLHSLSCAFKIIPVVDLSTSRNVKL